MELNEDLNNNELESINDENNNNNEQSNIPDFEVVRSENSEIEDIKVPRKVRSTPTSDDEKLAVLTDLIPLWDDTKLPLAWMPKTELVELAESYTQFLATRNTKGASRGAITSGLRKLDDEIDVNIEYVKNRLAERLGSKQEAVHRYREFGIKKEKSYKLPLARDHRVQAFPMLIAALTEYNFLDTSYGIDYWTDIYNRYKELQGSARTTDGTVSGKVGSLKEVRSRVNLFNKCFILLIKGNYPTEWKTKLREFGFHKEKY